YLRQQAQMAERTGLELRPHALEENSTFDDLRAIVDRADHDRSIDAVLIEHPLPAVYRFAEAVDRLRPEKDVDGVGAENLGRLASGRPLQVPAVARAAVRLARHYGGPLSGRRVAVVGRSPTVGIPIALLVAAHGEEGDATVTLTHSLTRDLAGSLAGSELIFSAAGRAGLLTRKVVPRGAEVVDVGVSSIAAPSGSGGPRAAGDADGTDLEGWAQALTPVPGGVGPVTVAMLAANTVRAWQLQRATEHP
ncbi:MAG: tetrahydrofolate dehydrogenase/cyclohydrolase catalytic domain-containing protein, partial [Thermoplasmata archaeon]